MKKLLTLFVFVLAAMSAWAQDTTPVTLQDGDGGTKYVNMPITGTSSLTLTDASVMYFKVYDDGGPYVDEDHKGNYSNYCDGYLILTAPAGYKLQVSGTIRTESCDYLTIYDGTTIEANQLLSQKGSDPSGEVNDIGVITSTGQSIMFYFNSDRSANYSGLDLDVILCKPENANSITIESAIGGVLHSDKSTALYGETVTLTWTHETGYVLESISVKDAYGRDISIVGGSWFNAATSFTMPVSAVTVTPKFIQATTSLDGLTVNLPKDGTKYCDIATGVKSFKVYDDGGPYIDDENQGKYSNNCRSYLVVTAPAGLRLQLTGTIAAETCDYLTVYDGTNNEAAVLLNEKSSKTNYETEDIGIITSTGETMTIYFYSDNSNVGKGLDLEVTLFDPNEAYLVDIVNVTGGAVSSDKATAKFNETVTLTETHDAGYILKEISVVDVNGRNAEVTGGNWHNVVGTFTMPASKVTVTPTFIQAATIADGLYINMPKEGTITTNISTGVKSFKVYDNGGKDGQYEDNCDGYLVLTVPAGYRMQLTGTVAAETGCDKLSVYDGATNEAAVLLSEKSSTPNSYTITDIGVITSTGNSLTLYFHSDGTQHSGDGLDLNVYVFNPNEQHAITIETAEGGVMTSDVTTAKYADIVTLTKTNQKGYALLSTTAKDANGTPIEVTGGTWYNDVTSFPMSIADATVTPTFTTARTAEDGLFINMPKEGVVTTNITNGIKSFFVYDDGGAENPYSANCDGTLILTAPIGYMLKIIGTINTESGYDQLSIWDGTEEVDAKLLLKEKSSSTSHQDEEIGEFSSTGRSLRLYFKSDGNNQGTGLNLKVTLIPITYTVKFDNGKSAATGTMDITGSMADIELTYDAPQNLPAVGFSRTAYDFTGWALTATGEVKYADKAEVENLATEQGATVTLYGKWTPIVYPITYDLAGGALAEGVTNPGEYTIESADFTLKNPTRRGYNFAGWTGTELSEATKTVTVTTGHYGERSYTATWTPIIYNITYDLAGGTVATANPATYTIESGAIKLNNPTRTGYTFKGWTGTDLTEATVTVTIPAESIGDRSYVATWEANPYKVSFDANGGDGGTMADQNFVYDTAQNLTENAFTRTGYTFTGWNSKADGTGTPYADKAEVVNLTATRDAVVTMYAQWQPITYYVSFNKNGGTGTDMIVQKFVYDTAQPLSENAYTRTGYNFKEWTTKADGTGDKFTDKQSVKNLSATQDEVVTIYAQWNAINYTIAYDLAGGEVATANPESYTIETATFTLNNPTRSGYTFKGWTGTELSGATMTVTIAKGSTGDRSYTATWERNAITLIDNADNSELLSAWDGKVADVTLSGRTFTKNNQWNTICLPFDLTIAGSVLDGAEVRTLASTTLAGQNLTMTFSDNLTEIEAGKPYVIRWASGEPLANPKFEGVTVENANVNTNSITADYVTFIGTFAPTALVKDDVTNLYLGSNNTLYYPNVDNFKVNAFRAYFKVSDSAAAMGYSIIADFGSGSTTRIQNAVDAESELDSWYTLNGVKLDSKPTQKGVFIHNGTKVVIK